MPAHTDHRANVWNSFLQLAWTQARCVAADAGKKPNRDLTEAEWQDDTNREPLAAEKTRVLGLLLLCNNALEARANHLIDWLREKETITKAEADAAKSLAIKYKWFLLPVLGRSVKKADGSKNPHKAVLKLHKYRNRITHARFEELEQEGKELPSPSDALGLWHELLNAVESMNEILGRPRTDGIDELKFS